MDTIVQPILVTQPEPGHDIKDVLTLEQFIALLKEEEDYWAPDKPGTGLLVSHLRKIFYDEWGWNSELIRGAKDVANRYQVNILTSPTPTTKQLRRFKNNTYQPLHREVVYTATDRVYGNTRAGQTPEIYKSDHQEVVLPDGHYCDVAHILAGVDAYNFPEPVSPLPNFLMFLHRLMPYCDKNMDVVTWLGDIASSSGDFLFDYLRNGRKPLTPEQEQHYIDIDAPGSDMVGDIDAYMIATCYDISASGTGSFTAILEDYYFNPGSKQKQRFAIFCNTIGLQGWNGATFANEGDWVRYYTRQLRNNDCFQVFSLADKDLRSAFMLLRIWFGGYKDVLKNRLLIEIWLKALKENLKRESI